MRDVLKEKMPSRSIDSRAVNERARDFKILEE